MGKSGQDKDQVPEDFRSAALPNLAFRRERAIAILSEGFARNYLQIEEFERRVAQAHGAKTLAELDRLVDDIPAELHALSLRAGQSSAKPRADQAQRAEARELSAPEQGVYGVMMSRTLRGDWLKSRVVAVRTLMSSTELDFRDVEMPAEAIEIKVACLMSSLIITVPEDLAVQTEVVPVLGEVKESRRVRSVSARVKGPWLRITGVAVMSEIKVRAR